MQHTPNKLRLKLSEGKTTIGTAIISWSPNVMEVAGVSGLDFVRIDNEHAWRQDSSLEHLIRAAAVADIVPILRVDGGNPFLIRKALETGAGGIVVPDVSDPEEAEAVVRAAKFPPRGTRGYSGNCWSGGWGGLAGEQWVEWSDREPMIGVMIESPEAVQRVDEILAVDGLDFVLFGPADYSMALGLGKPSRNDDRVRSALEKTVNAVHKHGKHVMYGCGTDPKEAVRCQELGITMLEFGTDLSILRSAWSGARKLVAT